ncbi:MAG: 1-acyl-sn-glycerol-3-phosphate acyltransferase [Alphaproteobacteria bacterium]
MTSTIELPVWLAILAAILTATAVFSHLLMPGYRWFMRRRVEQVIDDVNTRLNLELPPFMLTRRSALIDRLVYDPRVMEAIGEEAERTGLQREEIARQAEAYAREIVPGFNAYFYFRVGYSIARRFLRFFYRVRIGHTDDAALAELDPNACIVMVMNHRSNFDYLLVTYLASRKSALSYAAGEWTLFWPMGNLLRAMGAYFVRRGSDSPLYRQVLKAYVQMAVKGRVPQGIYPEGALSRDGALQPPKLGLLDYMTQDFDPGGEHDIIFIPVGINYERVVEDQGLTMNQDEHMISKRGTLFVLKSAFGFLLKSTPELAYRRRTRFGRACANFGAPVSLREWMNEKSIDLRRLERQERFGYVARLADELMDDIGELIPVLPVSLVATAFWESPERSFSMLDLKARAHQLVMLFEKSAAHVYLPHGEESLALEDGLKRPLAPRMIREIGPGRYAINENERTLLEFYVRPVLHYLPENHAGTG